MWLWPTLDKGVKVCSTFRFVYVNSEAFGSKLLNSR